MSEMAFSDGVGISTDEFLKACEACDIVKYVCPGDWDDISGVWVVFRSKIKSFDDEYRAAIMKHIPDSIPVLENLENIEQEARFFVSKNYVKRESDPGYSMGDAFFNPYADMGVQDRLISTALRTGDVSAVISSLSVQVESIQLGDYAVLKQLIKWYSRTHK